MAKPFSARSIAGSMSVENGNLAYFVVSNIPDTLPGTPTANLPFCERSVLALPFLSQYISNEALDGAVSR